MENLKILPRFKDSISFIYLEHCIVKEDLFSIKKVDKDGETPIPVATINTLLLGPGVSVTHAAVKNICDCGCCIVWCGENCSRFYASGKGETSNGKQLLIQAKLCMDKELHLNVVREMYRIRFADIPNIDELTLEQLRGIEGIRMKSVYKMLSKSTGVKWTGRTYDLTNWNSMDDINRAISKANQFLYAICYASIISMGYSPGLGFIHTGRSESFVYDIADLYKAKTTIPAAFHAVAKNLKDDDLYREIRRQCKKYFMQVKLTERIPNNLKQLMFIDENYEINPATELWDYKRDVLGGGRNYLDFPLIFSNYT